MMYEELISRYPALSECAADIKGGFAMLHECIVSGGTILACGNGGSAADSDHLAGELVKGFHLKRPLTVVQIAELAAFFPDEAETIAANLQQAIPAISLVGNAVLMTAVANDTDPDYIFAQQVYGLGRSGDVLIGISTSGNSVNVVNAAKVAGARGLKVLALTGAGGGALKDHADVCIRVAARRVDKVQELHLPVYHFLCAALEEALFGKGGMVPVVAKAGKKRPEPSLPETIALIVFDFDGVFTDNKVYTAQNGDESVMCDRRDGLGIDMLREAGVEMFILSKERNPVVAARAKKLNLAVKGGCDDKATFLNAYFEERDINPADVIYMGNDLNDLEAMKCVGFSVAPADSHPEILKIADLVTPEPGGHGAIRNLAELVLRHTGEH